MRIAAVVAGASAPAVLDSLPAITSVLARDLGLPPAAIGSFGSADSVGTALGALCAVRVMRTVSPRAAAYIGFSFIFLIDVLSAAFGGGNLLAPLRMVGGVGVGLVLGAAAYVYGLGDRERTYAASMLSETALGIFAITMIPLVVNVFGWRAMFAALALLALPGLILCRYFPGDYASETVLPAELYPQRLQWLGLCAAMLFSVGQIAMWAFLDRLGAASHIAPDFIAHSLSMCGLGAFVGAAFVIAMGERVSGAFFVAVTIVLHVVSAVLTNSAIPKVYATAITVFEFSVPLYITSLFGLLVRLMSSARFAVKLSAALTVGTAIGPIAGGLIAERFGVGAVRWLDISCALLSTALLILACSAGRALSCIRKIDNRHPQ